MKYVDQWVAAWATLRSAYMDPALTSEHEGMVIDDGCPRCRTERRLAAAARSFQKVSREA